MCGRNRFLRIGLLTGDTRTHFCASFTKVAEQAGHTVIPLYLNGFARDPRGVEPLSYYGAPVPEIDVLVPRIGAAVTIAGIEIVRKLEARNLYCLASSAALSACRDQKIFTTQMLAAGISMPKTVIAESDDEPADLVRAVGGPPLVIKLPETARGEGVILARTFAHAVTLISSLLALGASFAVQKFIDSGGGADVRCLVLKGRALAAVARRARAGEFRANLYQGGIVRPASLTEEIRSTSIRAAQQLRLEFAGVDLICAHGESYILEVNALPGVRSFDGVAQEAMFHNILSHLGDMAFTHAGLKV